MISFLDLHKINGRFRDEFQSVFSTALDDAQFILGANVTKFENEFAAYCGSNYCVGTANGLDALTLILKAYIQLGKLKKGDKVIVPANTFIATILSILHTELEPVFVEPNPETYNLSAENVKAHIDDSVKAIVMVHLYGQLADVEGLKALSEDAGLLLIADAAQAHGASCHLGKVGNLAHATAFSFYPTKNLGALGDGGAITTNSEELVNALRLLRNYGSKEKYKNDIIGFNSRLDDLQAALLSVKLKVLDLDNQRRQEIAKAYLTGITNSKVQLPFYDGSNNHVFYAFVVEVEDRDGFIQFLDNNEIQWLIHYPIPPHKQKALKAFSNLSLPITEKVHKRVVSVPMSPVMTNEEVQTVIKVINSY
jgi:dTDP-4-amino-4,6-dideoxygalactose transaminase